MTDDEFTILGIAAEGESLAAIARWEKPVDDLVARGLLKRGDKFNNFITPAGRAAFEQEVQQRDQAVVGALQKVAQVEASISTPVICGHASLQVASNEQQVTCKDCGAMWVRKDA